MSYLLLVCRALDLEMVVQLQEFEAGEWDPCCNAQ